MSAFKVTRLVGIGNAGSEARVDFIAHDGSTNSMVFETGLTSAFIGALAGASNHALTAQSGQGSPDMPKGIDCVDAKVFISPDAPGRIIVLFSLEAGADLVLEIPSELASPLGNALLAAGG